MVTRGPRQRISPTTIASLMLRRQRHIVTGLLSTRGQAQANTLWVVMGEERTCITVNRRIPRCWGVWGVSSAEMPYDEARLAWTSSVNVSKAERVLIWASAIRAFEGSGTSFTTTTTTTTHTVYKSSPTRVLE